jgi:iron complex outermembrane receptor protein
MRHTLSLAIAVALQTTALAAHAQQADAAIAAPVDGVIVPAAPVESVEPVEQAAPAMLPQSAGQAAPSQPASVTASTAQVQQLDSVNVVASYSRALEQAVDIKRANIGFSDSIVATDVGDFPEQNLAEALQRMPGVTIERNRGLGSKVNVRGLPSDYTHVTINNLSTATGSGGRDVEFDVFASEIIQQVTVQKSPTAADEEGGIAGNVKISTARPFDYNQRQLVVSGEGAWNDISGKTDPRFSFMASDTWGSWGALVSLSAARRSNRTDSTTGMNFRPLSRFLGASGVRGEQAQDVLLRDAGVAIADRHDTDATDRVVFQDKVSDRVYSSEQDKYGATASLQFRPSKQFSLTFDAMLGRYDTAEDEYDNAAYTASSRSTLDSIHSYDAYTLSQYGMVVLRDVDYTATQHESLSKQHRNVTDFQQFSLTLNWQPGDWDITAMAGYSGADKTSDYASLKHVAYAPSRSSWNGNSGINQPGAGGFDMYNAADQYLFQAYDVSLDEVSDDKYAAQLDLRRSMSLGWLPALQAVQFGARHTDNRKTRRFGQATISGPGAGDSSWVNTRRMTDSPLSWISDLAPGGAYAMKGLDWQQVANADARSLFRYDGFSVPYDDAQFYQVDEVVDSAYAMADFAFDIGRVGFNLNAGLRYVDTTVTSAGFHPVQNADGSTGYTDAPISRDGSYDDLLPSLNMTADFGNGLLLRAAGSKTMIRPALTDIAYRRTASWSSYRYNDGNPDLQPTYATGWELGIEKYMDNGGLLAASWFSKTIDGVVIDAHTGIVPDVTVYNADGSTNGVFDFDIYQPVNANGSYKVDGIELLAQFPLSVIHPVLEGFGVNANYTLLDSSLAGESSLGIQTPMPGLSERSWNATVYFENARFDARLSWNQKSEYVESIGYGMYPVWRDAYGQLDLSVGYQVSDRIKLSLKGINMTNAHAGGYTMDAAFPTMYEMSGRRVSLGMRVDF